MFNLEKMAPILFLIMWSSGAIFVKMGLADASVWSFLTLRATGAFVVITLIVFAWREQQMSVFANMSKAIMGKLLLSGLLLQVCYQGCYFLSIHFQLSPGLIAMVLGLQPLLTPFCAKEHISSRGYFALILGFTGLILAVYGAKDVSHITVFGVMFGIGALLAITVGSIYQKKIHAQPIASALIQNALASIIFLAISLSVGWKVNWSAQFILSATWMIVVISTGAILLLLFMLNKDSASSVSVLFYLVPVLTIVLDYLVFGASITVTTVFGACMVISSIHLFRKSNILLKTENID